MNNGFGHLLWRITRVQFVKAQTVHRFKLLVHVTRIAKLSSFHLESIILYINTSLFL